MRAPDEGRPVEFRSSGGKGHAGGRRARRSAALGELLSDIEPGGVSVVLPEPLDPATAEHGVVAAVNSVHDAAVRGAGLEEVRGRTVQWLARLVGADCVAFHTVEDGTPVQQALVVGAEQPQDCHDDESCCSPANQQVTAAAASPTPESALQRLGLSVSDVVSVHGLGPLDDALGDSGGQDPRVWSAVVRAVAEGAWPWASAVVVADTRWSTSTVMLAARRDHALAAEDRDTVRAVLSAAAGALDRVALSRLNSRLVDRVSELGADVDAARQHLDRLRDQAMQAHLLERRSIAADLHDDTLQTLTATGMLIDGLLAEWDDVGDEQRVQRLRTAADRTRDAMEALRRTLSWAAPESHDDDVAAVAARIGGLPWEGLRVEVDTPGRLPADRAVVASAARVVHEALRNVRKHARTDHARVRVRGDDDRVWVEVADDGVGFSAETLRARQALGHHGVAGMAHRAEVVGGELLIDATPGSGTTVTAVLPRWG